ncbi:vegetative incompatibility protein HET-E-1 [Rhizoctonia solani AG-3 Rhs1AP]|uniref:Vegetative incompatibility protein HET-E-1 n=1 Tax=Rhizoctonia solani AG-3 Rhs1AP TaxID=1086054 RepID=X8JL20_9AGAM|nr:vegetative incompatibility protein HET-E-1 [Rhizoctonia solani AG-3 Rhs1AP]
MPPPIPKPKPKPKRQLSIPFFNIGGKRSRTSSPSRAPSPGTSTIVVTHPHNVAPTTAACNSLPGGEPGLPVLSLSSNHSRDSTNLAAQGTTQGPPVAPIEPAPNRDTTEASWTRLEKALAALHITTKICPPLHSAIEGLKSCLHIFEEAARSRKDYKELAIGLTAMISLLIKHMSVAASKDIMETVGSIAKKITEELESIDKRQSRSGPSRMLGASRDDDDLIRRYRRIEQLFRQLQAEASMSTWDITKRHHVDTQLEKLGPVKLAIYNSRISMDIGRRSCTENTRTKILSDSMTWADDPNGAKIYWMNGMAGTGKTTIAYSLCERLEASGQLAASFFCTRASRECSEAKQIVPTIAYQLARRSAPFRDALCGILDKDPDVGALNTASQFDSLLAKPLLESAESMARNLVIVVDALDECNDPHAVRIVLDILFRHAANLPVKFFVTSRPEPAIRNSMMAGIAESNRSRSILYLHEIEKSLVQADIELYLKDELNHMLPVHCTNIEDLAEQAGNLFIYAATAVRYIQAAGKAFSSKRLGTILDVTNTSRKSLSSIDALYSAILTAAIHDNELEPEEQEIIRVVLWTAICAHEPVLVKTLAALSGFDETDLAISALQPLRSVLHVSEHNNFVTTLHASFPDFMFSQERSQEFFCDRSSHDHFLARRCLEVMKAQLQFNICKLESSFNLDDEIPDLKERITTYISQELFYACRFWVDHLNQVPHSELLLEMVYEFLSQRLLFWMEVLNLNKCMVVGAVASTKVNTWLRTSQGSSDLINLAYDAQTFVGNYAAHQVSTSTPHIYLSALPFSSPTSQIRLIYQPRFKGLTRATGTLMDQIDQASLAVWESDHPIRSASFSADRKYIAIGDDSGRISVRHPHNGECLITFRAHRKVISSVSFSSDATLIASSSYDYTVCIWNVSNGLLASGPFKGHNDRVTSAMFSPDNMHIASGSEDCTIRIWTIAGTSECRIRLTGHTSSVKSVMFSPNGLQIVSGSRDRTVRIWDTLNGALLHNLRGHTASITCVRFSPCGAFIVSASNDRTIRVWDTHNGAPIGDPLKGHSDSITSIAISPGGERIVSGSLDNTVRVWDRYNGMAIADPFRGTSTRLGRLNSQQMAHASFLHPMTRLYAYGIHRGKHTLTRLTNSTLGFWGSI